MSTENERLQEVYAAYRRAMDSRSRELKDAKTTAQVDQILANIDALKAAYLRAASASLDKTGPQVEAAFRAAKEANEAVTAALAAAKALPERIRAFTKLAEAVGKLVAVGD